MTASFSEPRRSYTKRPDARCDSRIRAPDPCPDYRHVLSTGCNEVRTELRTHTRSSSLLHQKFAAFPLKSVAHALLCRHTTAQGHPLRHRRSADYSGGTRTHMNLRSSILAVVLSVAVAAPLVAANARDDARKQVEFGMSVA